MHNRQMKKEKHISSALRGKQVHFPFSTHLIKNIIMSSFKSSGDIQKKEGGLASFLWDIGKLNSPRCDAAKRESGANLFAYMIFNDK